MAPARRSVGAAAKFTGSGGAAVALCPEGDGQAKATYDACRAKGFEVAEVILNPAPSAA